MTTVLAHTRVDQARALAQTLLDALPERWAHTAAVAATAWELAVTVDPTDRETLVTAAWLHDIGYGAATHRTGFHPVDGATYLRDQGWPDRICGLVAHHSGAVFTARVHRLDGALSAFAREQSPVSDALTYADQTVGPGGQRVSIEQRMTEMLARHGTHSAQARVHPARGAYLRAVARRVERRLATS